MTFLAGFLDTYWLLIPLSLMLLWFLLREESGICRDKSLDSRSGYSALEVLDRRYASGEIGSIEYEDKVLTMGLKRRW